MKKLLLASVLLLLLVSQVSGLALTFQNSGDFANYFTCHLENGLVPATCSWQDNSSTCSNSYVALYVPAYAIFPTASYVMNADPLPTTYAAADIYYNGAGNGYPSIALFDSSGGILYTFNNTSASSTTYRYEMKMVGGQAYIYRDGTHIATSGVLAQNPSYVAFGGGHWSAVDDSRFRVDDFVMGDTENGLIFGVPANGCYIRKDPIGGGSGLYNAANTLVSTYNMSATWAKKSDSTSINIVLQNYGTGVNVDTRASGTSTIFGTISYPIADEITGTSQPYGYFVVDTDPTTGTRSRTIPYQMGGATAYWAQDYYSQNDIASITTSVSAGYWDTGTYNYQLKITDLYGNVKQTSTITSQAQGTTYQFTSSDDTGVYVAWLYATNIATGAEYLMFADTTTLMGYVRVNGYAYNATAMTELSSVHINVTQSVYYDQSYTSATGYYNTSASVPFGTGSMLTINATKTGYRQRYIQFTPTTAKTLNITIPMEPLTRAHTGIMLHGLVVDNVYRNPVASPTILAYNTSAGQNWSVEANRLGDYVFEDGVGTVLTSGTCYHILAVKSDYTFVSPTTPKCVYGV